MRLKKGLVLVFKNREEVIVSVKKEMVKTDKMEYSVDFIMRWLQFGFVKVKGV